MKIDLENIVSRYPKIWQKGFQSFADGNLASSCPYKPISPINTDKMNVWLSGWVTASENNKLKSESDQ